MGIFQDPLAFDGEFIIKEGWWETCPPYLPVQQGDKFFSEIPGIKGTVCLDYRFKLPGIQLSLGILFESITEPLETVFGNGQSCCHCMTAEFQDDSREMFCNMGKGIPDMQIRD